MHGFITNAFRNDMGNNIKEARQGKGRTHERKKIIPQGSFGNVVWVMGLDSLLWKLNLGGRNDLRKECFL